jgi:hypothetical protein
MARTGAVYAIACGCLVLLTFAAARTAIGALVGVIVGGAMIAYGAIVLWPIGVETTPTGVIVRGPYGSSTTSWRDIQRFELSDGYPWSAWLVRTDGTLAKAWGLGVSGLRHERQLEDSRQMVDALNGLLCDHRGAAART